MYEFAQDDYYVYMVFEIMDEDLFQFVDRVRFLDEKEAICIVKQILDGVGFLHDNNIIHRDLKVDNIFCETLEGGAVRIVIGDFGFSICTDHPIREPCGNNFWGECH